jgi:hypothetical protein
MLLMLMNKTGMRKRQIRLTNCRPEIRARLTTSPVADLLCLA